MWTCRLWLNVVRDHHPSEGHVTVQQLNKTIDSVYKRVASVMHIKEALEYMSATQLEKVRCLATCCSVLQCVAVCCSVLQRAAVCCSVLQCAAE